MAIFHFLFISFKRILQILNPDQCQSFCLCPFACHCSVAGGKDSLYILFFPLAGSHFYKCSGDDADHIIKKTVAADTYGYQPRFSLITFYGKALYLSYCGRHLTSGRAETLKIMFSDQILSCSCAKRSPSLHGLISQRRREISIFHRPYRKHFLKKYVHDYSVSILE